MPPGAGLGKASLALANRWITTRQFGLLLGFMGQRVLGQYDLALLSAEAEPGQLLFVEENVRQTARTLGVPLDPFRTWIALHETTHAFEFEAHPWLRPYLADRLERQLGGLSRSASDLGRDASRALGRALRGGDGHWLERLMSDEQRRLFRETQTVMSLLEGFADHVMDEVGRDLVPGVETISARFHARRAARTPMERAILRITGLDLKMEQYARGRAVRRGRAARRRPRRPAPPLGGPGDAAARRRAGAAGALGAPRRRDGRRARRGGVAGVTGPGSGPGGVPRAIALSPVLSARYRPEDLAAIGAAAPGSRIVTLSREGLADGPIDDVEVLLHGFLAADAYERLLARAPHLRWVHSAAAGVERLMTPAGRTRGLTITNARGVFSRPIAEYVLMMVLAVNRRLPQLLELAAERTWQPLEGRELRDTTLGIVGFGSIGRAIAELAAPFEPPDPRHASVGRPTPRRGAAPAGRRARRPRDLRRRPRRGRLRDPRPPADARNGGPGRRQGPGPHEAERLAGQRRPGPAHRGAGTSAGPARGDDRRRGPRRLPRGAAASPTRRSTSCRTSSSRRTPRGPAAAS